MVLGQAVPRGSQRASLRSALEAAENSGASCQISTEAMEFLLQYPSLKLTADGS